MSHPMLAADFKNLTREQLNTELTFQSFNLEDWQLAALHALLQTSSDAQATCRIFCRFLSETDFYISDLERRTFGLEAVASTDYSQEIAALGKKPVTGTNIPAD